MTKAITQTESFSETDEQRFFGWGDDIFATSHLGLEWRPKDLHFLMELDGAAVSHVAVLKHDVSVAGEPVTVGGVGGVVTLPAFQKRGCASELMQHTAEFFGRWEISAGLLFCIPDRVPFYESLGWQLVRYPVVIEQSSGEVVSPLEVMVLPLHEYCWPEGDVRLNSLPW